MVMAPWRAAASRARSKRFAQFGYQPQEVAKRLECVQLAAAFGPSSPGLNEWSWRLGERRQAGRAPNASRSSGTSLKKSRSVWSACSLLPLLAPAVQGLTNGHRAFESAGKPGALQTLRAVRVPASRNREAFGVRAACCRFWPQQSRA